jgi:hypothetical protein
MDDSKAIMWCRDLASVKKNKWGTWTLRITQRERRKNEDNRTENALNAGRENQRSKFEMIA